MGCGPSKGNIKVKEPKQGKGVEYAKTVLGVKHLNKTYNIDTVAIGAGAYAKVYQAVDKHDPTQKVAIKVMDKQSMTKQEIEDVHTEIKVLLTLDHPNVVKFFESYDDKRYIYLVMQFCDGGELAGKLEKKAKEKKAFAEHDAAKYIQEMLVAIHHSHSMKIVHRDIKLENVMLDKNDTTKMCDFGLSNFCKDTEKMTLVTGTPYYLAPEVTLKNYDMRCDIWSIGVCCYKLVSGDFPFKAKSLDGLYKSIRSGQFKRPNSCSDECMEFLTGLMTVDINQRFTCEQALKHPWIKDALSNNQKYSQEPQIDADILTRLMEFRGRSALKRAVYNMLAKLSTAEDTQNLHKAFRAIDTDNSGVIDLKELKKVIQENSVTKKTTASELEKIIQELDYNQNQKINYSEFIAATITVQNVQLTQAKMLALFKKFDVDGNDSICMSNIRDAFTKLGYAIKESEINQIISEHDNDNDQEISFQEFKEMIQDLVV